jgi:nucleoside 2-deoxyribosyltransferase
MSQTIYFAGSLFNHKDLFGNKLLASAIENSSEDRYSCLLPQDIEFGSNRAADIRNGDLKAVFESDIAIFNFDGTELDSGTVVEFMVAKFLDIPALILRTDFRKSGDQESGGENWNLMCSFYPRTESLTLNSMELYHKNSGDIKKFYADLAKPIIEKLDLVVKVKPIADPNERTSIKNYLKKALGGKFEQFLKRGVK